MTKLPQTFADAEADQALAHALQFVAAMQQGDFIGLGCAPADPDAGRRFLRRMLAHWMGSARGQLDLVNWALAGWADADIVLRELIVEYSNRHEAPPAFLAFYIGQIASDRTVPRKKGRKKATNLIVDIMAVTLIMDLIERYHLKLTRYQAGKKLKESACSVAAKALSEAGLHRGGERALMKILDRYKPGIFPGSVAEGVYLGLKEQARIIRN